MISKVLVANRSEIAVRIMRAAREEGISPVAVYSEVDRNALHVRLADEVTCIGPATATQSYLDMDKLIEAAKQAGCQAVHPGYGFLSENADFARKVTEAGLVFIGPGHEAIAAMGDKLQARALMTAAKVPVVPGVLSEVSSPKQARQDAEQLGYPILVKAAGGGGGKGIRLVHNPGDLEAALETAAREAAAAFSDARVYMEKYLERPRHVEVQILADTHGNAVHVFERECSIQRRHQKIIEESPSVVIDDKLRAQMGAAAVRAAKAVGYRSAGTVEFLVDEEKNFYFLEMNTRIQVEHPITELTAGIDLVRQQFRIANGAKLPFAQEDLEQRGHAIECRIYAEDPDNGFLPSPGMLLHVAMPHGPGVRVDAGIDTGIEVSTYYDPILAKIITWGEDRETARQRMILALQETVILGVATPIPFLLEILRHEDFIAGRTHTHFLDEHGFLDPGRARYEVPAEALVAAAMHDGRGGGAGGVGGGGFAGIEGRAATTTPWAEIGPWKIGG